jgi:hypothetical protein
MSKTPIQEFIHGLRPSILSSIRKLSEFFVKWSCIPDSETDGGEATKCNQLPETPMHEQQKPTVTAS